MEKSVGQRTLLIWDADGVPPVGDWTYVLWQQCADIEDKTVISIAQLVEKDADELRARYLAWIYDLGEARINGARIIDHMSIRPGFSYWWMSSLAQKFNISGNSSIDNAIKALALEMLVVARQVISIVLISGNSRLADCVRDLCHTKSISYEWRPIKDFGEKSNHYSLCQSLPHTWRAYIYFAWYVWRAIPLLLQKRSTKQPDCVGEVMFVDVLVHLDKRAISDGVFVSNYWTTLVEKLTEWKLKSNWLHIFFRHSTIPSLVKAWHQIGRFNKNSNGSQCHNLIENFLSFRILVTALRDYLKVSQSLVRLREIGDVRPAGSGVNLWPLHIEAWNDSLCGKEAIINCLRVSLLEDAIRRFPSQKIGIYIAENQPWEMALVHFWKTSGHGTLIGIPHATVRFWDLRYHYDARSYLRRNKCGLPLPDVWAVNGPAERESVLAGGYPLERVTEVEALRFLHLLEPRRNIETGRSTRNGLRVLVCGDFLAETSRRIIAWLEIAAQSLPHDTIYVFKPHPAYSLNSVGHTMMKLETSVAPLGDLFGNCDVVFTSNMTSAAVDAYCFGLPVVQMLDGKSLNISPLRGFPGVVYVSDPSKVADALRSANQSKFDVAMPYFYLDRELPRWKKLICNNLRDIGEESSRE